MLVVQNLKIEGMKIQRRLQKMKADLEASAAVPKDTSSVTSSIDESPQ